MKKPQSISFGAALLALTGLLASCSTAPGPSPQADNGYVLTVAIKAEDSLENVLQQYGGQAISFHPEEGFAILKLSTEEKAKLSNEISIQTVPNSSITAPEASAAGATAWSSSHTAWGGGYDAWAGRWDIWGGGTTNIPTLPADNRFSWTQIKLPQGQAVAKNFGQGVKVAVIDTGIDTAHPMFSGRLAPSTEWKDYVGGDTNPAEVSGGSGYGHGTATAGIILQAAPKATILPIRVLDQYGKGDVANVVSAIDWAIQKGAKIINLSLGTNVDVPALKTQVDYATSQGVYIITSAGNEGSTTTLTYPAQYATTGTNERYIISVGSIKSDDGTSTFSNKGTALELVAPGENIYTAYPGSQMVKATGTSFAAPIVAGAVALGYMDTSSSYRGNLESYLVNGGSTNGNGHKKISVLNMLRNLPDFTAKQALFVVGNPTLNSGDSAVKTRLEGLGYTVTVKDDSVTTSSDATGKALVLISSTIDAATVNSKFRSVTVPVMVMEAFIYDDMRMATSGDYSNYGDLYYDPLQTQVTMSTTVHPLTAGLTGSQTIYTSADDFNWAYLPSTAIKTASDVWNSYPIFGYDSGTSMAGITAPARRVGFFLRDTTATKLTNNGYMLFDAAVTWAATGN